MRRHSLRAIAAALVLVLAMPGTGGARAEVVELSGAGCCVDVGVRLTVNLEALWTYPMPCDGGYPS